MRLRELVFSYFEEFENSKTKEFDPKYQQEFKRLLTDSGQTLEGEWSFDIDGLSLSFSALRNSDNIGLFADSRETRTTTPNLFNLGTSANLKLLYDGPSVAFETGLRAQLQSIFLNVEGQDIPPQEQRDDLLTYVEGRANLVRLSIGDGDMQLVPFSRFALDSEFTPTPENPAEGTFYPHQLLFRQELGVVLNPPKHVQEIRIGALIQEDMGSALGGATSFWITEQPLGQR